MLVMRGVIQQTRKIDTHFLKLNWPTQGGLVVCWGPWGHREQGYLCELVFILSDVKDKLHLLMNCVTSIKLAIIRDLPCIW